MSQGSQGNQGNSINFGGPAHLGANSSQMNFGDRFDQLTTNRPSANGQPSQDNDLLALAIGLVQQISQALLQFMQQNQQGNTEPGNSANGSAPGPQQVAGNTPVGRRSDQGIDAPMADVATPAPGVTNNQGAQALPSGQTSKGNVSDSVGGDSRVSTGPSQGAPRLPVAEGDVPGGDTKALNLINDGNEAKTIKFVPNAGGKQFDDVTLQPGESKAVVMPEGWSGNVRQTTGGSDTATLGEFTFGAKGENNFFDVSLIEGFNGPMVIQPRDGGQSSGVNEDLLASAPDSIKEKDADGNAYGIKKALVANQANEDVVKFYKQGVDGSGAKITDDQAYVRSNDDRSTLGTTTSQFDVHIY
jgi:hypothetical protein